MAYNWQRGPTRFERYGKRLAIILGLTAAVGLIVIYSSASVRRSLSSTVRQTGSLGSAGISSTKPLAMRLVITFSAAPPF